MIGESELHDRHSALTAAGAAIHTSNGVFLLLGG